MSQQVSVILHNGTNGLGFVGCVSRCIRYEQLRLKQALRYVPSAVRGVDNLQPFKGQKVLAILALVD